MIGRLRGSNSVERFAVIGEHFYQPPRKGSHTRVKKIHTDPHGMDWNNIIIHECYIPQTQNGTLDHVSFDFYTTIRREMLALAPKEVKQLRESMKARGVGDPFLHVLLPDLNKRDKEILVKAGYLAFEEETKVSPKWFWAPETALDNETLETLVKIGYKGVLCAPEQIDIIGTSADNKPIILKLPNKANIIALPFDRPFSSSLAFSEKSNADAYTRSTIIPRIQKLPQSQPLIGWTDGETFGHHVKLADLFLDFLVKESLPNVGIAVLGLNDIQDVWEKKDYQTGKLRERTAWSCPHGNLVRWHGACPCDGGHHGSWKENFSTAISSFNQEIDKILDRELGRRWADDLAQNFSQYFYFTGSRNSKKSLMAVKASALAAMTSCGTFFESPETSGNINMLFIHQALENLKDAGFEQLSQEMKQKMLLTLSKGIDPFTKQNLAQLFSKILS
ncbi:hypothetical protein KKD03_00035 [Patescibacteria group bacterium]|nr:hypothetical protein [Patescibacteria group bacterium]